MDGGDRALASLNARVLARQTYPPDGSYRVQGRVGGNMADEARRTR